MPFSGKRLAEARSRRKLSQAALAEKLGITPGAVGRWEAGFAKPDGNRLADIARLLGVRIEELYAGEKPLTYEALTKQPEFEPVEMPAMHKLPVVESIAANHLPGFTEAKETEFVSVKYPKATHYCLRVKGQSMRPLIYEGDIVIVEKVYYKLDELLEEVGPADKHLWKSLNKKVVCASVDDDDPVLKRMRVTDRKDTGFKITLQGDNPTSDLIEVNRDSRLKIFGIVRQIMRDPNNFNG